MFFGISSINQELSAAGDAGSQLTQSGKCRMMNYYYIKRFFFISWSQLNFFGSLDTFIISQVKGIQRTCCKCANIWIYTCKKRILYFTTPNPPGLNTFNLNNNQIKCQTWNLQMEYEIGAFSCVNPLWGCIPVRSLGGRPSVPGWAISIRCVSVQSATQKTDRATSLLTPPVAPM